LGLPFQRQAKLASPLTRALPAVHKPTKQNLYTYTRT
jgi:hypothetical protein